MLHHVVLEIVPRDLPAPRIESLEAHPEGVPCEGSLTHWFVAEEGRVEAHYVFDETYARAHPEALDTRHLELLQGIVAAKFFDDGEVVVTREQIAASLRWPSLHRRSRPLT